MLAVGVLPEWQVRGQVLGSLGGPKSGGQNDWSEGLPLWRRFFDGVW